MLANRLKLEKLLIILIGSLLAAQPGCGHTGPGSEGSLDQSVGTGDAGAAKLTLILNTAYPTTAFQLMTEARSTLKVVHLFINEDSAGDEVVKRLGQAAARGVKVQVLLEDSVEANPKRVTQLTALGVTAKVDSSKLYTHAKLIVADGKTALLGSSNFSYSSMYKNNEANVLATDPQLAGFFESYAEALWQDSASHPTLASVQTPWGKALRDGQYVAEAKALIEGATSSVRLLVYGLSADPKYPTSEIYQLLDLMGKAVQRGLSVRVILEQADYASSVNDLNKDAAAELKKRGIAVRRDPLQQISHAKVTIVDGKEAIVASNNWGYGGFSLYHEVGVRTTDATVLSSLSSYIDGIWQQGADF